MYKQIVKILDYSEVVVTSLLSFTQGLYRMTVKTWPVVTSLLSFTQGLCRMTVKTWAVVTSLLSFTQGLCRMTVTCEDMGSCHFTIVIYTGTMQDDCYL
jgi:hypothetical protein